MRLIGRRKRPFLVLRKGGRKWWNKEVRWEIIVLINLRRKTQQTKNCSLHKTLRAKAMLHFQKLRVQRRKTMISKQGEMQGGFWRKTQMQKQTRSQIISRQLSILQRRGGLRGSISLIAGLLFISNRIDYFDYRLVRHSFMDINKNN